MIVSFENKNLPLQKKESQVKRRYFEIWMILYSFCSAAVYPRWHPDGRYIAFSTNLTSQAFHSVHNNLVEVYDSASDLIIYDTETQSIFSHPLIHSSERFETLPEWAPDGKSLYFCSAPAVKMPENYDSIRYDLHP